MWHVGGIDGRAEAASGRNVAHGIAVLGQSCREQGSAKRMSRRVLEKGSDSIPSGMGVQDQTQLAEGSTAARAACSIPAWLHGAAHPL